jgi:hypothetical protein
LPEVAKNVVRQDRHFLFVGQPGQPDDRLQDRRVIRFGKMVQELVIIGCRKLTQPARETKKS